MFSKSSAWAPFGNGSGKMETKKIKKIVHGLFVVNFCAFVNCYYPRRARSALGVDTVLTLDVCMFVCMFVGLYVC